MSDVLDPLTRAQKDIAGAFLSHPYFDEIAILEKQEGVINSDILTSLGTLNERGGKIGAAILVMLPLIECENPDATKPQLLVTCPVRAYEMPLTNRSEDGTNKWISGIELEIIGRLHKFNFSDRFASLYPAPRTSVEFSTGTAGVIGKEIYFQTRCSCQVLGKTSKVAFSGSAAEVMLSSSTPGAVIYYNLDGGFPRPGGDGSELYTDPFTVDADTEIRAAAYAANHYGSDIAAATLN